MIKVFSLENREDWDSAVCSFADHDVYYLSGYLKGFELHGDGEPLLFFYEGNEIRAMNVVMKRDIAADDKFAGILPQGKYFDFATPYGYGGWLIEGNGCRTALFADYEKWCRNHNIISEFVRFHPLVSNHAGLGNAYDVVRLGKTVTLKTDCAEAVWQNFSSKNRNVTRKAIKSGLRTYWGREPGIIEPFMQIYNATMVRDDARDYYFFDEDFYVSILEDLKDNAMWFYTMIGGEIAAIAIFMFCNKKMHYHLSAGRPEYRHLAPSNLLLYEAALWACRNGYHRLHLGGGLGSAEDSLYKFKKAFYTGDDTEFFVGKKIFVADQYRRLVELRREVSTSFTVSSSFFPEYRA